jgi:hypothetical protein
MDTNPFRTQFQLNGLGKGLSASHQFFNESEMDQALATNYFKECTYLGALDYRQVGLFYPIIFNEGAAYFAFQVGAAGTVYNIAIGGETSLFSNVMSYAGVGGGGPWYMTITKNPCDFDYKYLDDPNRVANKTACGNSGNEAGFVFSTGNLSDCALEPGKIYYINIRREQASIISARGSPVEMVPAGVLFYSSAVKLRAY